uniref:F-BAR domain-containing protein n=1 Tax=Bursaphelenchus xylophilus TaxID=6326 RepID=A0A1I7S9V6_BURXY
MEVHTNPVYHNYYDKAPQNVNPTVNYFHQRHSSISDPELTKIAETAAHDLNHNQREFYQNEPTVHYRAVPLHHTASEDGSSIRYRNEIEENTYYNPHYMSRTPSSGSSNAPSSIDQPIQPHYYEIQPTGGPTLLPLNMVDRDLHSRRVSALLSAQNKKIPAPQPPKGAQRRFSMVQGNPIPTGLFRKHSEECPTTKERFTFGKKSAAKLIKKSKLNAFSALGTELSQSASALYNLFTSSDKTEQAEAQLEKRRREWNENANFEQIYSNPLDVPPSSPVATVTQEPRFLAGSHLNDAGTIPVHLANQRRFVSTASGINDGGNAPNLNDRGFNANSQGVYGSIASNGSIYGSITDSMPIYGHNNHYAASIHYAVSSSCHYYNTDDTDTPRAPDQPAVETQAGNDPVTTPRGNPAGDHEDNTEDPAKKSNSDEDEESDEAIGSSLSRSLPSTCSPTSISTAAASAALLPPLPPGNQRNEALNSLSNSNSFPEFLAKEALEYDGWSESSIGDEEDRSRSSMVRQAQRHSDVMQAVKQAHLPPMNMVPVNKTTIAMVQQAMNEFTDQTNQVSDHTQRGIDFLDKYGQFVKERAQIEDEYALKLRNLVKKCGSKKKEDDEYKAFSYFNTFNAILRELGSLAAQHETISEKLRNQICPAVATKCNELRAGRKRHLQELQNLNNQLTAQVDHMNKMKKGYLKAFKEAETAYIKHDKADKNMEISRAELERTKANLAQKNHACHDARCRYYEILQQTNLAQKAHYEQQIPQLLERMRQLDMDRIAATKNAMSQTVDVETGVLKVVQRCYDDMRGAIAVIDPEKDTHVVVEIKKTGYSHPPDFAFQDLGDPARILENNGESVADAFMAANATLKRGQVSNGKAVSRKGSMHHRIFGGSANSNGKGPAHSEYGNLPPQQRCRKLEHKIAELNADIAKREHSKAGLQKMLTVYTDNPKLGNAADVEHQINEFQNEINHLVDQRSRFAKLLQDSQNELNQPSNGSIGSSSPRVQSQTSLNGSNGFVGKRTSYSEDSISSDGSAVMGMPRRNGGPIGRIYPRIVEWILAERLKWPHGHP